MSQKNGTLNFLIRDANGQPQMVKVIKSSENQPVSQVKVKQNPMKIIKLTNSGEGSTQAPVFQALKFAGISCASKLVQVPVGQLTRLQQTQAQQITPKTEPVEYPETEETQDFEAELEASPSHTVTSSPVTVTSGRAHQKPPPRAAATMSHASRRRHEPEEVPQAYTTKRRKHADKVGKGLRHFSMKVCEKVRTKVLTTYNEVADELVLEFSSGLHGGAATADSQQYDQKNIRRRVYDALNVLMAMNIISKEKKEIRWLGLPTNSVQECSSLEKEKQARLEQIQKKTQQLHELILQHISFKSLIERNKESENKGMKPSPSSAIHLPFIVVNTSDKALIDCSISNDKTEYMFNFNKRFQIHDDIDILKRMGLLFGLDRGECSEEDIERAKGMVPKSLESYVEQMGRGMITKLTTMLEEAEEVNADDIEVRGEAADDDEEEEEEQEPDEGEVDGEVEEDGEAAYSDEDSDVDV